MSKRNKEYDKQYRLKNKVRMREYHRNYMRKYIPKDKKKNPEKWKKRYTNSYIKHMYGITVEEYNSMVESQNNLCKICYKEDKKRLCIDHCHKTNKIRGLLCRKCNFVLGLMDDNIDNLYNAIEYLKK